MQVPNGTGMIEEAERSPGMTKVPELAAEKRHARCISPNRVPPVSLMIQPEFDQPINTNPTSTSEAFLVARDDSAAGRQSVLICSSREMIDSFVGGLGWLGEPEPEVQATRSHRQPSPSGRASTSEH